MSPKPEVLRTQFRAVGIEISVQQGEKEMLRAKIRGPKGTMELSG
jgi:hypothetical protein